MTYCSNCGTELKEGVNLCPKCGKSRNVSDELAAITGMLDFYSDRAVGHISTLLVSIFGLVTLLAIVQGMVSQTLKNSSPTLTILTCVSLFPFVAFAYLGYHAFRMFGDCAVIAHKLELELRQYAPEHIKEYIKKRGERADKELIIKQVYHATEGGRLPKTTLDFAYLLVMTILGFVVYWQIEDTIFRIYWSAFILILAILIFLTDFCIRTIGKFVSWLKRQCARVCLLFSLP